MSTTKKCLTMTVRRERRNFLEHQLTNTNIFILQLFQQLFSHHQEKTGSKTLEHCDDIEVRKIIILIRNSLDYYELFYSSITTKYKHIDRICQLLAEATVAILQYEQHVRRFSNGILKNPIQQLFEYVLMFAYSTVNILRPTYNYELFKSHMRNFVASSIELNFEQFSINDTTCDNNEPSEVQDFQIPEITPPVLTTQAPILQVRI